jgi:hypothetical protein
MSTAGDAPHAGSRHNGWMHLAQLNVGRLRAPMADPFIDDFRVGATHPA